MNDLKIKSDIQNLEETMRSIPGAIVGDDPLIPLKHTFGDGIYVRDLNIPKDTLLVGKVHKKRTLNILLKGEITVMTEDGVRRLKAPLYFISPSGSRKVGYTHEETILLNVHATEETDLDKIEEEVISKNSGFINVEIEENKIIELSRRKI